METIIVVEPLALSHDAEMWRSQNGCD